MRLIILYHMLSVIMLLVAGLRLQAQDASVSHAHKQLQRMISGWEQSGHPLADLILAEGESPEAKLSRNLFVRVEVSKKRCYEGEPIFATYKLYTRVSSESRILKRPAFPGFSVYDMVPPEREQTSRESINGREFNVYTLRRVQLVPLQSGTLQLDPVAIDNTVFFVKASSIDPTYPFIQEQVRNLAGRRDDPSVVTRSTYTISSEPVSIQVLPIPSQGQPENFNGAVGEFEVYARMDKTEVRVGEAVRVLVTVQGWGDIPLINAPSLQGPDSMEVMSPLAEEKIDKSRFPISGKKVFTYTLLPQEAGEFKLPPVDFSFFNPLQGRFDSSSSEPLQLRVREASEPTVADINTPVRTREESKGLSKWWWAAGGTSLLLLMAGMWLISRRRREPLTITPTRKTQPELVAMPETEEKRARPNTFFGRASWKLESGDEKGFYKEIHAGIWWQLAQMLELRPSQMNRDNVVLWMQESGYDESFIRETSDILDTCETMLYAPPVFKGPSAKEFLSRAEAWYERVERFIR